MAVLQPGRDESRGSVVGPIATAVGAFALGYWAGRPRRRRGPALDRAWATPEEVRGRFPEEAHHAFLRRAIANARRAWLEEKTGWPFGAVVVNGAGVVVADGSNQVFADFDPTAHAEVQAIRAACSSLRTVSLAGSLLYSSSEPCPMCLAAAYWSGLDGVVFGASAEDGAAINGFEDGYVYDQLAASRRRLPTVEMLRDEAVALLEAYRDAAGEGEPR